MHSEISFRPDDMTISALSLFWTQFEQNPTVIFECGVTGTARELRDYPDMDPEDAPVTHSIHHDLEEFDKMIKYVLEITKNSYTVRKRITTQSRVYGAFITIPNDGIVIEMIVCFRPGRESKEIRMAGCNENEAWVKFQDLFIEYTKQATNKKDIINIIATSHGDFFLNGIEMDRSKSRDFTYDHYNDGFEKISERVITTLQTDNESGLVLLHGDTGTGKTSYLKHLLHIITSKRIIYVPPDLTESLSAPAFMNFLISNAKNSILLIEDAENVLKHREAGGNQAVSNILNISNGILGDILRMQIVCTFNCSIQEIDPALLRPGRLVAEYQFDKLTTSRARNLVSTLHGEEVAKTVDKPLSLAEAFNITNMPDKTKIVTQKLGFV